MNDRNDLPPATSGNFLARVREELTIMMGNRGTPLDQAVRFKDLQNSSLLRLDPGFVAGNSSGGRPIINGLGPGVVIPPVYAPDLTPPPTPTGFIASAAISNLFVQTDAPLFTMGHGYLRTILYGASRTSLSQPAPTYANAVQLMQFIGPVSSYATNPSTIWHLWVKWMTVDGVLSVSPAGGTNGLSVTTGVDVQLLINALTGKITSDQLYIDLGARINLIDTPGMGLVARVTNEVTTRTTETGALSSRIDSVQAVANTDRGTAAAAVTRETTARVDADGAISSRVDTVQATATSDRGAFTSAISTEQTARANADGTLFSQYSVKVDVNGYVSGFGLSSTAFNAVPISAFAVRADQFYIASPSGPGVGPTVPFVVRTTPTTINGVNVPVGVYIQDAFIANGTISNAKIGNAAIDDAKIANLSASKLTAGQISVGAYINSSTYIAGSQGWSINGNGSAEFSGVVVRGTIYASAGQIGSCSISGDAISSANYNGTNGWSINQSGQAYFGNVALRGSIASGGFTNFGFPPSGQTGFYLGPEGLLLGNANDNRYLVVRANGNIESTQFSITDGSAKFGGTLQGASGTFSGSLTANAINAVQTVNIGENAATVMVSAQTPNGNVGVSLSLAFAATVQLIGQSALPNNSLIELKYRPLSSPDFVSAGFGAESVQGGTTGVLCAKVSLPAGSYEFAYFTDGLRSTIIALATFR